MYNVVGSDLMEIIDHIKFVIDKVRPFLISDGGDVEFIKFESQVSTFFIQQPIKYVILLANKTIYFYIKIIKSQMSAGLTEIRNRNI